MIAYLLSSETATCYDPLVTRKYMKKTSIIVILIISIQCIAISQVKSISVRGGIVNQVLKDKVFSDLKFEGFVSQLSLDFQSISSKSYWSIALTGNYGGIGYNEFFNTQYLDFNFIATYARSANQANLNALYVGASFKSLVNIIDYDGYENGSWLTGYSVAILLKKNINLKKTIINTELSLPIGGLLSRPPYAGRDEFVFSNTDNISKIIFSRNKFYSFNNFINPCASIKYAYSFSKTKIFSVISYEFIYLNSIHKYLKSSVGISVGLTYNFNKL